MIADWLLAKYIPSRAAELQIRREDERTAKRISPRRATATVTALPDMEKGPENRASISVKLAGVPGLEPRTTVPETAVLPITPYPNDLEPKSRADMSL